MSTILEVTTEPATELPPQDPPEPAEPADALPETLPDEEEDDEDPDAPVTDYPDDEEEDSASPPKRKRGGQFKREKVKGKDGIEILSAPRPLRSPITASRFDLDPKAFFFYAKSLAKLPDMQDRLILYGYRTWPVMIKAGQLSKGAGKKEWNYAFKLTEPCDLEDILVRYGSGDYHFKLNDCGPRPNRSLAMSTITGVWRDLNTHPPILDLEKVDKDDPANKPYLRWLKSRGELTGNFGEEGEEPVAVISEVLQSNKEMRQENRELTEKLIEVTQAKAVPPVIPIAPRPSVEERGIDRILETQAQAFAKTFDQATAVFAKQADPVETFTKMAAAIAPLMRPAPVDDGGTKIVIEMMSAMMKQSQEHSAQMLGIVQAQLQETRAELAAIRQRDAAKEQTAAAQPNPTDPLSMLDRLINLKDKLDGLTDGAPAGKTGWLDAAKEIIAGVAPTVQTIVQGYVATEMAKAGVKPGTPQPQTQPGAVNMAPPIIGAGSSTEGDQTNMAQMVYARLAMYAQPLLTKYNQGESGADFAGWMAEGNAQDFYLIKQLGKDMLLNLISQYPPIWDAVQLTRDRFGKFIDEFLAYDPAAVGDQAEE